MLATARDGRCVIEVVNTADGAGAVPAGAALGPPSADPAPVTAEHGRGLKIIDAVTDNLELTGDGRAGTTVHFEKDLSWVPGRPASTCSVPVLSPPGPRLAGDGPGPGSAGAEGLPPLAPVQHLRRGPAPVAQVAGRLVAVPTEMAPMGVNWGGMPNSARKASIRSGGSPKKHAPSPASTTVSSICRDANPVSMSQYGAGHRASLRSVHPLSAWA